MDVGITLPFVFIWVSKLITFLGITNLLKLRVSLGFKTLLKGIS